MREPYTKLNLTNKRGLGGMKKPEASSVSPRDSHRSDAFHQASGELSITDQSRFLNKRMTQPS